MLQINKVGGTWGAHKQEVPLSDYQSHSVPVVILFKKANAFCIGLFSTCPFGSWLVGTSKGKLIPFLLIDAPFSLVVDTVFFPFEYQYTCNF